MANIISDNKESKGIEITDTEGNALYSSEKNTTSVDNAQVNGNDMQSAPLHKLFVSVLKDIYFAEHAVIEALGEMQKAATTDQLKKAFEDHQTQTRKQVSRLENVFKLIDEAPEKKECKAVKWIIEDGQEMIKSTQEGSMTRDAALILAAQKVEHYEIATYGGLAQLATTMGHDKAADLLKTTLKEEEDTDYHLTEIAETVINFDAYQED